MNLEVINHNLSVDHITILAVTSSSVFLIGDTNSIQMASTMDTPESSLVIGPFVPLPPEE